jgi:glycosyltransferase involved in cell wall biosynthesis
MSSGGSRRIVIVSPSYATQGGVETIVSDLCHELPSRGWEPILALAQGARFNDVARYREAHPGLRILEVDGTKGTKQARLEALAELIRNERPDILLSFRVFDAYHAAVLAKHRHGCPRLAIAIRGYEPHYLFDARLYRTNIDLCIVDGDLLAAAAREVSELPPDRVVSIPGGIRAPERTAERGAPSIPLRLGYVGRLAQADKRVLDMVELVELLARDGSPFLLSVVGAGPEEGALRSRLAPFVQRGIVRFLGWMTNDRLYAEIYPTIDCLVNFSAAEGVTISPREAMAHGVVPVISGFTGLRAERMFVHGVNSLVFPVGDIRAAATHVRTLIGRPEYWAQLAANARQSQTGKYSAEGAMDLWARMLDECAARPPLIEAAPDVPRHDDGRLARLGLSPWWAQRIRDLLRARPVPNDPGSEWPTGSGLMTPSDEERILRFAREFESANRG